MTTKITKAVFPVAGLGTRFLPATKSIPKEMLPLVDKPIIHFAVQDALSAGITELIFVTGRTKRAIEDYFDGAPELERALLRNQNHAQLAAIKEIVPAGVNCIFTRQAEPLGLGHAVLCARPVIGNEPFAVLLPDDYIHHEAGGCINEMKSVYEKHGSSVLAVEKIDPLLSSRYGMVKFRSHEDRTDMEGDVALRTSNKIMDLVDIVEKPQPQHAPSDLAAIGRYILTPQIFDKLEQVSKCATGEIQLTDAIALLAQQESIKILKFNGRRFDCGSKSGYMRACLFLAMQDAELRQELIREFRSNL